ncbi:flagellar hook-basal body protein [Virgibacillus halophilus]|uniref:Flagellar hook-basal body protein n=1 Tax=Tigheibacillus halophilus TaxID=361280 RepID=A0ABU5C4D9_9BACI|nr:flagellar hook-basal body protein [Virgibacillus halophilus]
MTSRSMIQAAVSMNQLQQKMDLIGNNLANSQTTGYKNRQTEFSSLLFQQINNMSGRENAEGRLTPEGIRVGSGARLGSVNTDFSTGSIQQTDRVLDTALLDDNHFFQIQVAGNGRNETQYTRDGSFYLQPSATGDTVTLTTGDGYPVVGENGPITIQNGFNAIDISSNGDIVVERNGQSQLAGKLAVTEAIRPRSLEAVGDNRFRIPDVSAAAANEIMNEVPANQDILQPKALETSNVDVSQEMSELLMAQRSYQFNSRTISMADQMSSLVNQLRS